MYIICTYCRFVSLFNVVSDFRSLQVSAKNHLAHLMEAFEFFIY